MNTAIDISVIVPVYNCEKYLEKCFNSLLSQTMDKEKFEVILVDDGSTDGSNAICKEYADNFSFMKLFSQENSGVSVARNTGIINAKGKYLLFLDSDDTLSSKTLENICVFFDAHYHEIDVLTYPIFYDSDEESVCDHFRYNYLIEDGVYDTNEYPFICQTTMNICVKRELPQQIFFNTEMDIHEDQDYICRHIVLKNKIGFVKDAEYHYYQNAESAAHQKLNPLYTFNTLDNFEELLNSNPESKYLKALFLYDFNWRLKTDQLYPYYLESEKFDNAVSRIKKILKSIDPMMVMQHPSFDYFHRYYVLKLMDLPVTVLANKDNLCLYYKNTLLHKISHIEIIVSKIDIRGNRLIINAFLKDVSFSFSAKPKLYAVMDGLRKEIPIFVSAAGRYRTKIETNTFYGFYFDEDISNINTLFFEVEISGVRFATSFYFMYLSAIDSSSSRKGFTKNGYGIELNKNNHFKVNRLAENEVEIFDNKVNLKCREPYKIIKTPTYKKQRIWLYYDCSGVMIDNGLLQFIHDVQIDNDGIEKFFIWNNPEEELPDIIPEEYKDHVVSFGSLKHKKLLFHAEKIITAYIENKNIYPFRPDEFHWVADKMMAEVIYLQHGILHATLPWKYTPEVSRFDRIVVSSYFEIENMKKNYHIPESYMIPAGMPRFEMLDRNSKPLNRILFAPSWRGYLIGLQNDQWIPYENSFIKSSYYTGINDFLNSKELADLLEENDLYLDFKPHPIFACYQDLFSFESDRVGFAEATVKDEEYCIFITDFSSFSFDFVWLKRPILYFVPDYLEFKAGCSGYRELDLPFDKAFGNMVQDADQLIAELKTIIDSGIQSDDLFEHRMNEFFLPIEHCRDDIYSVLIASDENSNSYTGGDSNE